jgi:hypothetical protein
MLQLWLSRRALGSAMEASREQSKDQVDLTGAPQSKFLL